MYPSAITGKFLQLSDIVEMYPILNRQCFHDLIRKGSIYGVFVSHDIN